MSESLNKFSFYPDAGAKTRPSTEGPEVCPETAQTGPVDLSLAFLLSYRMVRWVFSLSEELFRKTV
jgi:hypothetical protein